MSHRPKRQNITNFDESSVDSSSSVDEAAFFHNPEVIESVKRTKEKMCSFWKRIDRRTMELSDAWQEYFSQHKLKLEKKELELRECRSLVRDLQAQCCEQEEEKQCRPFMMSVCCGTEDLVSYRDAGEGTVALSTASHADSSTMAGASLLSCDSDTQKRLSLVSSKEALLAQDRRQIDERLAQLKNLEEQVKERVMEMESRDETLQRREEVLQLSQRAVERARVECDLRGGKLERAQASLREREAAVVSREQEVDRKTEHLSRQQQSLLEQWRRLQWAAFMHDEVTMRSAVEAAEVEEMRLFSVHKSQSFEAACFVSMQKMREIYAKDRDELLKNIDEHLATHHTRLLDESKRRCRERVPKLRDAFQPLRSFELKRGPATTLVTSPLAVVGSRPQDGEGSDTTKALQY